MRKWWKKAKAFLKYLFTERVSKGTAEESSYGFDMFNITEQEMK